MPELEYLVATYGYAAVFVGCFVEGETILVLAAFAAHRGYLSVAGVCLAAFAGSFLGDQLYFFLGRRYGAAFIERRKGWRAVAEQARHLLDRYGAWFILMFRFLYGVRTVSPFVLGASGIRIALFASLNLIAAALWSISFTALGYGFGAVFVAMIERAKAYEKTALAVIAAAGALIWLIHFLRRRLRNGGQGG